MRRPLVPVWLAPSRQVGYDSFMPITQERQIIQEMRAAGFSEQQALVLAANFEATAQATSQDLKTFIGNEIERLRSEIRADMKQLRADLDVRFAQMDSRFAQMEASRAEMEARFERSLRILLVTLISTFVGVTGLAVALIKLLP